VCFTDKNTILLDKLYFILGFSFSDTSWHRRIVLSFLAFNK